MICTSRRHRRARAHGVQTPVTEHLLGHGRSPSCSGHPLRTALVALSPIAVAAAMVDPPADRIPTGRTLATAAAGLIGLGSGAATTRTWATDPAR